MSGMIRKNAILIETVGQLLHKKTPLGEFFFDLKTSENSNIGAIVSKFNNCFVFPAFCDVHVHLREPGFSYKETIESGTKASAKGGYSDVFSMPNLNPVPDSYENLKIQLDIIERDAVINVHPYASITIGQKGEELSDFEALSKDAIAFSDDGRGVQSDAMMRRAMEKAKAV